jgi:hypothetical protein
MLLTTDRAAFHAVIGGLGLLRRHVERGVSMDASAGTSMEEHQLACFMNILLTLQLLLPVQERLSAGR